MGTSAADDEGASTTTSRMSIDNKETEELSASFSSDQLLGGEEMNASQKSSSSLQMELSLPQLAELFQTQVPIQNRMYHLRVHRTCFVGKEAVDCLVYLTKKSRSKVLELAKVLQEAYCPFEHVCDTQNHPFLEDDYIFYRFLSFPSLNNSFNSSINNNNNNNNNKLSGSDSDISNRSASSFRINVSIREQAQNMTTLEKIQFLERGVQVQDRKYHLRTYPQCFIGKEAVDFLVQSGAASDRKAAVELGNLFMREHNVMEHVTREHDFEDKHLFYRFVKRRNRFLSVYDPYSFVQDMNAAEDSTESSFDGLELDRINTSTKSSTTPFYTSFQESYSADSESQSSRFTASETAGGQYTTRNLQEVADAVQSGIVTATHRWRFKYYKNSFIARDVVTFLVSEGFANDRDAAVRLGKRLHRELNLFHHVCDEHDFQDAYLFFCFTLKEERYLQPVMVELPLREIAKLFENGIRVREHTHRLKKYPDTFVGRRAVDFMVQSRIADSRIGAVRIGRALAEHYKLFEKVTGDMEFCDDIFLFRFVPESKRQYPSLKDSHSSNSAPDGSVRTFRYQDDLEGDLSAPSIHTRISGLKEDDTEKLSAVAKAFRAGVKVKNNRYRTRVFQQTFIGSDAVTFLVNSSFASSRKEAVELGRRLEKNLFQDVSGQYPFKDDLVFYRFNESKIKGSKEDLRASVQSYMSDDTSCTAVSLLPLEDIADMMKKGVKIQDRRYHLRVYKSCFVGYEGVDFLLGANLAESRVDAVDLGRKLCKENFLEHVCQDHDFKDAYLFYRFLKADTGSPHSRVLFENIDMARLISISMCFEEGMVLRENRVGLRAFKDSFYGSEAVDYFLDRFKFMVKTRRAAVQLGRKINNEFNVFEHVTNDYYFKDCDKTLYHFTCDAQRAKCMFFKRLPGQRKLLFENLSSRSGFWESICEVMGGDIPRVSEFEILTEDSEWAAELKSFERQCSQRKKFDVTFSKSSLFDIGSQETAFQKARRWATELRELDPRYQILSFFDIVAQEGLTEEENHCEILSKRPLLHYLPNRASVFSVWRPCSKDSIRRMMLGEAVGKGLDIKGKSAKRGKLSAFVPFLQISNNNHKLQIRMLSKDSTVRVFYGKGGRRARDLASEKLATVAMEMKETVNEAKKILSDDKADKSLRKAAYESMLLDMSDPVIRFIDDYAPESFGIEIPERLFWEAYCVRQDISRRIGSEYDTGRPSVPAFQDMNFATIRKKVEPGSPRVVVYQYADPDSPMNPFELLLAYEERGRVLPVVSDFDCFLVGTRRVSYSQPMPPEQLEILRWMLSGIEHVVDNYKEDASWMAQWIQVLKKATKAGFHPEIPRFGLGDPKSYSMMLKAVDSLQMSGAVRHGAESFNYLFPQELEDEFLVLSDDIDGPLPWKYLDIKGLQDFLSAKVDRGFTFPLNPKWILMNDPRWKELYDKMLQSGHENIVHSMNTWFPANSGIREEIERIHQKAIIVLK